MGWWSCDVLGGDEPYDVIYHLEILLGLRGKEEKDTKVHLIRAGDLDEREQEIVRKAMKAYGLFKLLSDTLCGTLPFCGAIAIQVIGFVAISCGVPLTEEDKKIIHQHIEKDEWAEEDEDRKRKMDEFAARIKVYSGRVVQIHQEGLFEKIGQRSDAQKS